MAYSNKAFSSYRILIFIIYLIPVKSQIYNKDTIKTIFGKKGTSFGFSLSIINEKNKFAIIGAPRDNEIPDNYTTLRGNKWLGSTWSCTINDIDAEDPCQKDENTRKTITIDGDSINDSESEAETNFNIDLNIRYTGLNVAYDTKNKETIICSPASFDISKNKGKYDNYGYCNIKNKNKNIQIFNKDPNTFFGYSTEFTVDNAGKNKILFTSPLAKDDKGGFSIWDSENRAESQYLLEDQKNENKSNLPDVADSHNRHGISLASFICNDTNFVAMGTSKPIGQVAIYKYRNNETLEETYIYSENIEFGTGFGFQIITILFDSKPFLLISSPFGAFGKIELFNACSKKPENFRLLNLPKNIKSFGYSLANIGNFDSIDGDDILVGAPNSYNNTGSITFLSNQNNTLKFMQTVVGETNSIGKYLGLSISRNVRNLDNLQGDDIIASGQDSISLIYSNPFSALANDVEIIWENDKEGHKIEVFKNNHEEVFQVCIRLTSNIDLSDLVNINSILVLDVKRDELTKRFRFNRPVGNNTHTKEITFKYKDSSLKDTKSSNFCTEKITVFSNDNWGCSKVAVVSIEEPIEFSLSRMSGSIRNNTETKMTFLESGYSNTYKLQPIYECSNGDDCDGNNLELVDISKQSEHILSPSKKITKRNLTLSLNNTGLNDVYGAYIRMLPLSSLNSSTLRITDSKCLTTVEGWYQCLIHCPIIKSSSKAYNFNLTFEEILGETEKYAIEYSLVKDNKILSKQTKYFTVETKILSKIIVNPDGNEIDYPDINENDSLNDAEFMHIRREFEIMNKNQVLGYDKNGTVTKITFPVNYNDTENNLVDILSKRNGAIFSR